MCDSGSRDGSAGAGARARRARDRDRAGPRSAMAGTRNLLMGEARGAHVALLTQDAEPADERWLERLLGGLRARARMWGSSTGPIARGRTPRRRCGSNWSAGSPRSSPEAARRSSRLARGGAPDARRPSATRRVAPLSTDRAARLLHRRQRLHLARGVGAGAVSRGPLRRGPGARDRHAARRLREGVRARGRGAALPRLHAPLQQLRRCFDEWRGLREVYGWREPASPSRLGRGCAGSWARRGAS